MTSSPAPVAVAPSVAPPATPCVVLVPGSRVLRYGLASDPSPQSMAHCIAYRLRDSAPAGSDPALDGREKRRKFADLMKIDTPSLASDHGLGVQVQAVATMQQRLKVRAQAIRLLDVPEVDIFTAENCTQTLDSSDSDDFAWTDVQSAPEFVVGDAALKIAPEHGYTVMYPTWRGFFNTSNPFRQSHQACLGDIQRIWDHVFRVRLGIACQDHNVAIAVPEFGDRALVKALVDLLLTQFCFRAVFVHIEFVCAGLGAGHATCCLVDLGATHSAVCCIEDGCVLPMSRIRVDYGGDDITRTLLHLLQNSQIHHFPYPACTLSNHQDVLLLERLKEELCHLNEEEATFPRAYSFRVRRSNRRTIEHFFNVSDALVIAPMGLFQPSLFGTPTATPESCFVDFDNDVFDEQYMLETRVKNPSGPNKSSKSDDRLSRAGIDVPLEPAHPAMAIDSAVLTSVASMGRLELQRKLFSTIIITGGSAAFPGLAEQLETRIAQRLAKCQDVELISTQNARKDVEPHHMSWKGLAIVATMDGAREMWIHHSDWSVGGARIIKEKCPFMWQR